MVFRLDCAGQWRRNLAGFCGPYRVLTVELVPCLLFLARGCALGELIAVTYLTPSPRAPTAAQCFAVAPGRRLVRCPVARVGHVVIQPTGMQVSVLFDPPLDDVFFFVIAFHEFLAT